MKVLLITLISTAALIACNKTEAPGPAPTPPVVVLPTVEPTPAASAPVAIPGVPTTNGLPTPAASAPVSIPGVPTTPEAPKVEEKVPEKKVKE